MAPLVAFRDLKALLLTLVVARCEWLVTAAGIFPPSPPALNLNGRDEDARLSKVTNTPKCMRDCECWVMLSEKGKGPLGSQRRSLANEGNACRRLANKPNLPRHILKFLVETATGIPAYRFINSYRLIARRPSEKVPRPRIDSLSLGPCPWEPTED